MAYCQKNKIINKLRSQAHLWTTEENRKIRAIKPKKQAPTQRRPNSEIWNHKEAIKFDCEENKMSVKELAEKYGTSQHTIRRILEKVGATIVKQQIKFSDAWDQQEQIKHDYEVKRMTIRDITNKYKASNATITSILKANNIEIRPNRSGGMKKSAVGNTKIKSNSYTKHKECQQIN